MISDTCQSKFCAGIRFAKITKVENFKHTLNMLYFSRAAKCLLKLVILLTVVFVAMSLTGTLETGGMSLARKLFASTRGVVLLAVIVLWVVSYPLTSFSRVSLRMSWDGERIKNAFAVYGYQLESEADERMTFRARSVLRRVLWQFDDRVTVTRDGGFVDIEGLKRIVPRVETRLKAGL